MGTFKSLVKMAKNCKDFLKFVKNCKSFSMRNYIENSDYSGFVCSVL